MTTLGTHDMPEWRHRLRHAVRDESPECWADITRARRLQIVRDYLRVKRVSASDWLGDSHETTLMLSVTIGDMGGLEARQLLAQLSERAETWVSLALVQTVQDEIDLWRAILESEENREAVAADMARKGR